MTTKKLIEDNIYLAEKIAKFSSKKYRFLTYDEIKSAAYFGLVQAANSYNFLKSPCFSTYASYRIFGAIKDYLREFKWFGNHKINHSYDLETHQI